MKLTWRRFCWIAFAVSLVLAAVGVAWYAQTPGVESYQASSLLTLPALLFVLVWLHQRLPIRLQWIAATAFALVGPVGYAVVGGAQWWNWGQVTPRRAAWATDRGDRLVARWHAWGYDGGVGLLHDLGVYFGLADATPEEDRRRKSPVIVGLLPEDPDDPPKPSRRELLLTLVVAAILFGVHEAVFDGWGFWATGAGYVGVTVAIALALRLWARLSGQTPDRS